MFLLVQGITLKITTEYIFNLVQSVHMQKTQLAADKVRNFFNQVESMHYGLGEPFDEQLTLENERLVTISAAYLSQNEFLKRITIILPTGREIFQIDQKGATPRDELNFELTNEQFEIALSGRPAYSKVYFLNHEPFIEVYYPIVKSENRVSAVIRTELSLLTLWDDVSRIKLGSFGFAYIVDNEGILIAHPDSELVSERPNVSNRPFISLLLTNSAIRPSQKDYTYINEDYIPVVAQAQKLPGVNWLVVFEQSQGEAYSFLFLLRAVFISTLFGMVLLLSLIVYSLSKNILVNIRKLEEGTELLQKNQFTSRIDIQSGDEFESLGHSFNSMAIELNERELILAKEKQKMETLLQSMADGVVAIDSDKHIILFNRSASAITNVAIGEALGKHIDEVVKLRHNDAPVTVTHYLKPYSEFQPILVNKEFSLVTPGGHKKYLTVTIAPTQITTGKSSGWIITFFDITREKELENMKLDFVSLAAHELRSPLTAIRGYTQVLLDEISEKLSADQKQYLHRLGISAENLANLIDNLLNVSRIERDSFKVELMPTDMIGVVKTVVDNFKQQVASKEQSISLEIMDERIPTVMADKFRISQVLSNLLTNAVTYTPIGGKITVTIRRLEAINANEPGFVAVSITDTGQGIPREALPRLFTKFFRVAGPLEEGSKGTGLGLFISKSIISLHQGEIWVESELNRGSTFTFTIPIATAEQIASFMDQDKTQLYRSGKSGILLNKERFDRRHVV